MQLKEKGFTLLEVIVMIAIIGLLAAMVFRLVNPLELFQDAEDKTREQHVQLLANAIGQFAQDNSGALPFLGHVTTTKKTICTIQGGSAIDCAGDSDQCIRITSSTDFFSKYLPNLPIDPDKTDLTDTGYYIHEDSNSNLIIGACSTNTGTVSTTLPIKDTCPAYAGGYCWYRDSSAGRDCNTVCAERGLNCVSNMVYASDTDSTGAYYCALNKAWGNTCSTFCTYFSNATLPVMNTGSICGVQYNPIQCDTFSGGWTAVCPCR